PRPPDRHRREEGAELLAVHIVEGGRRDVQALEQQEGHGPGCDGPDGSARGGHVDGAVVRLLTGREREHGEHERADRRGGTQVDENRRDRDAVAHHRAGVDERERRSAAAHGERDEHRREGGEKEKGGSGDPRKAPHASSLRARAERHRPRECSRGTDQRWSMPLQARKVPYLTAAFSLEPALTLTPFDAAIWMVSPVAGLRPARAARWVFSNDSQPGMLTFVPLPTCSATTEKNASTTLPTAAWLSPVSAAIAATRSLLLRVSAMCPPRTFLDLDAARPMGRATGGRPGGCRPLNRA